MRILRSSVYPHYRRGKEPLTTIVRDQDLKISIEEFIAAMPSQDIFIINEILTVPDNSTFDWCLGYALAHINSQDEANMAMLYYFDADELHRINPGGTLAGTVPTPLSIEQVETVLKQLAKHSDYQQQTIKAIAQNGTIVTLIHGQIVSQNPEDPRYRDYRSRHGKPIISRIVDSRILEYYEIPYIIRNVTSSNWRGHLLVVGANSDPHQLLLETSRAILRTRLGSRYEEKQHYDQLGEVAATILTLMFEKYFGLPHDAHLASWFEPLESRKHYDELSGALEAIQIEGLLDSGSEYLNHSKEILANLMRVAQEGKEKYGWKN